MMGRTGLVRAHRPGRGAGTADGTLQPGMASSAEVVDPRTVLVRMNAPPAGEFLIEMSQRDGAVVSPKQIAGNPGAIDSKPIGAGPFALAENLPRASRQAPENTSRAGGTPMFNAIGFPQLDSRYVKAR